MGCCIFDVIIFILFCPTFCGKHTGARALLVPRLTAQPSGAPHLPMRRFCWRARFAPNAKHRTHRLAYRRTVAAKQDNRGRPMAENIGP